MVTNTPKLKSLSYKKGCACWFCARERDEHTPTAEFDAKRAALAQNTT